MTNSESLIYPDSFIDRIICGDSLQIMRQIPDQSIELVVTSPPYNLKNSTGNGMKEGRVGKWSGAALIDGYSHHNDNMPHEEYVEWQRNCLTEMLRIIPEQRKQGILYFRYQKIYMLQRLDKSKFIDAIEMGKIWIDFDARTGHNHGTKFRLRKDALIDLYASCQE